ncbi:MAG: MFS transporter, partial [Patescibacteria group bacterium]
MSKDSLLKIGKMGLKHKEKFDSRKVKLVSFISFLMGFIQALFLYVMSTYFKEASGTENVGPFYLVSYVVVLVLLLNLHKLVRIFGKSFIFLLSLILKIVSLSLLLILPPSYISIGALMLYIVAGSLEWVSLDIILESFSIDNMSGSIRGKHLTIINLGYLVGPFLSTQILEGSGYRGIFIILLLVNAFLLIISALGLRRVDNRINLQLGVRESLQKIWKRKNILRSYWASFVLDFFYSLIIIYTPIYLLDLGIPWDKIGIIFTLMLVPFVVVQYPLGILADRKTGEKEWMFLSVL